MMHISGDFQVDTFFLLGSPISQSLSPRIHTLFAAQLGKHLTYQTLKVEKAALWTTLDQLQQTRGVKGVNITAPCKEAAYAWITRCSTRGQKARAINTIRFSEGRPALGDNTDGIGWIQDLTHNLHINLHDKHMLLLGAGGAARGILAHLSETEPTIRITLANRTREKAEPLAQIPENPKNLRIVDLDNIPPEDYDLILNSTSNLTDEKPFPLNTQIFSQATYCYDLSYTGPSIFLETARHHGVPFCFDGLGMLVEQAAEAFHLWYGEKPDTTPVIMQLRQELGAL